MVLFAGSAIAANVLKNPDFSSGGKPSKIQGAAVPGGSAALPHWTTWNNSDATTTTEDLRIFQGRRGVIHVKTSGASNGLVQVMAQDKAGWGNGALLNALAPGASQTVDIPVYYLMSESAFMWTPPNVVHPFLAIADLLKLVNETEEKDNTKGPIRMSKPLGCPPSSPPHSPIPLK